MDWWTEGPGDEDFTPYDEDGEIAMMRVLETNEVQRWETEQEEGMIAALWN